MKTRLGRLLLLSILLFTFFESQAGLGSAYTFTNPAGVEAIPGVDQTPSALQATNGTLWVSWDSAHLGTNQIFYSTPNATGWSPAKNATWGPANESNAQPALGQLQNGTIILMWSGNVTGHFNLYYRLYNTAWSQTYKLTDSCINGCVISNSIFVGDMFPQAIRGPDSRLWVFWERDLFKNDPSCPFGNCRQVWYKTLNGNVWSADTQLTSDPTYNQEPAAATINDGTIRVAYSKYSVKSGNYNIFSRTYNGIWSGEVQLTTANTLDIQPAVVQDRNGTTWVLWSRQVALSTSVFQYKIFYITSPDNGVTWSKEAQLTFGGTIGLTTDDFRPSAVQGRDRNLWVFYSSNAINNDFNILYIKAAIWPIHELAVTSFQVSQMNLFPWYAININVTVANHGDFIENVQLSVQAVGPTTLNIGSSSFFLAGGGSKTVSFNWNATGSAPARYSIVASVPLIPGETVANGIDNSITLNPFSIYIPGDMDMNGRVDTLDASLILVAYGTRPGDPLWNPNADLNRDGVVNIIDLGMWGANFGRSI